MDENKTVNISLPKALLDAIDKQAEAEFRNRSDLIRESVRIYIADRGGMSQDHKITNTEHDRIAQTDDFASLKDEPTIALSCVFRPQPNSVEDIFTGDSRTIQLVEDPPAFRRMGWDLKTLDRARPVAGEYLEVANGKRKLLRLYRDGQHAFIAGMDFFGWAANKDEPDEKTNLNMLAVAECIANFAVFSKEVAKELRENPNSMVFTVTVRNPNKRSLKLCAGRYLLDQVGEMELPFAERNIVVLNPGSLSSMKIAYEIYAELCYFFGMRTDELWYVDREKHEINKDDFIMQG